jgi:hypothetical protein
MLHLQRLSQHTFSDLMISSSAELFSCCVTCSNHGFVLLHVLYAVLTGSLHRGICKRVRLLLHEGDFNTLHAANICQQRLNHCLQQQVLLHQSAEAAAVSQHTVPACQPAMYLLSMPDFVRKYHVTEVDSCYTTHPLQQEHVRVFVLFCRGTLLVSR